MVTDRKLFRKLLQFKKSELGLKLAVQAAEALDGHENFAEAALTLCEVGASWGFHIRHAEHDLAAASFFDGHDNRVRVAIVPCDTVYDQDLFKLIHNLLEVPIPKKVKLDC